MEIKDTERLGDSSQDSRSVVFFFPPHRQLSHSFSSFYIDAQQTRLISHPPPPPLLLSSPVEPSLARLSAASNLVVRLPLINAHRMTQRMFPSGGHS